ncbi:hypothetical protein [Cupriavidus campinensis]|uniref:hypothetical protein n=1 Tax=Cupriavidus campinensis TaxID=151783 RepID=UPI0024E2437F|nr:hypothetical protein [Cupriavidus campinensis]
MKRLYARLVLWLIRPALEMREQRRAEADAKEFVAFQSLAPWSGDRATEPILLDDPEAQSRLIERAVFPFQRPLG